MGELTGGPGGQRLSAGKGVAVAAVLGRLRCWSAQAVAERKAGPAGRREWELGCAAARAEMREGRE